MNKAMVNKISKYFEIQPIEKAWVFGSHARAEATRGSDIDILVNFSRDAKITLFKYIHIMNDLRTLTGKRIDLVEDGQLLPFAKESADQDKILIYERKTKE
jgi:predicted nucleotidyltransferase